VSKQRPIVLWADKIMSEANLQMIVNAVVYIVCTLGLAWIGRRTINNRAAEQAVSTAEVKETLADVTIKQEQHAVNQANILTEVVKQTNHIKDELVAEVRQASFAAGQKDIKDSINK
jgi:hypothetical protein